MSPHPGARGVVVTGLGNPWRGDDAAGLLVARRVRELAPADVTIIELEGEPLSVLDAWQEAREAFVVDAVSSGAVPGTVHRVDAHADSLPEPASGTSTHALGLAEAIELGGTLGRLPSRLIVYGIEGERFGAGDRVTAAVEAAAIATAEAVCAELGRTPA